MAKRKRLSPANPENLSRAPEVKSWNGGWHEPALPRPAPIADVAGQAATQAALDEVSAALTSARKEGRLVQKLPITAIETAHLVRDRISFDAEEMEALKSSLAARGQQTPIEVVALDGGRYGLISGWRRIEALTQLGEAEVLALIREPEGAAEAYVAMIEENEIRADLSYYERARLAVEAERIGVYPTVNRAVAELFAAASSAKRSKILKFVPVYRELDQVLQFPASIPERLGLSLSAALETHAGFPAHLRDVLRKAPAEDAATERKQLERAVAVAGHEAKLARAKPARETLKPGLLFEARKGRVILTGKAVTPELQDALRNWLAQNAG